MSSQQIKIEALRREAQTDSVWRGIELEPLAIAAYEAKFEGYDAEGLACYSNVVLG